MPFLSPNQQRQSTEHNYFSYYQLINAYQQKLDNNATKEWKHTEYMGTLLHTKYNRWRIESAMPETESSSSFDWLTELWFYVPLDRKYVILETFPIPISWLGKEKLNLTENIYGLPYYIGRP